MGRVHGMCPPKVSTDHLINIAILSFTITRLSENPPSFGHGQWLIQSPFSRSSICYTLSYHLQGMLVSLAAMYGSSMVCHSIPYTESFGSKHLAWMVHCGVVGAVLAPLCILGGPLLTRAALYTSGIVGGR